MVCFVGHEIAEEVDQVRREVLPRCWWYCAATRHSEFYQLNHALAAAPKRAHQPRWPNCTSIDCLRNYDAVTTADHLDPRAAGVVNVCGDGPNSTPRRTGNSHGPQFRRQVFDEIDRDAIVRSPRIDQAGH